MLSALNTRYYRSLLHSAGLGTSEEILRLGTMEEALARLPRADPSGLRMDSLAMVSPGVRTAGSQELFWPIPRPHRAAVLAPGFRWHFGTKTFHAVTPKRLERFSPEALAGPVAELQRVADRISDRWGRMHPLSHSVLAFVIPRQAFLSDETREMFWRVFQAPVFGQIHGLDGELLAWECEAHEGYHIDGDRAVMELDGQEGEPELLVTSLVGLRRPAVRLATGLTGSLEDAACGCGARGRRLVNVRRRARVKLAVAAASAA